MGFGDVLDEDLERIASHVVDAIFRVHATFGPGLLETIYEQCLVLELES
jgi:GxxExxY protein